MSAYQIHADKHKGVVSRSVIRRCLWGCLNKPIWEANSKMKITYGTGVEDLRIKAQGETRSHQASVTVSSEPHQLFRSPPSGHSTRALYNCSVSLRVSFLQGTDML